MVLEHKIELEPVLYFILIVSILSFCILLGIGLIIVGILLI